MFNLKRLIIALSVSCLIFVVACTSEVVREVEVPVVSEMIREVTVVVEKAVEVPVPQTVIVEKPVEVREVIDNIVIETVVETVVVEKEVTVEVPIEREISVLVEREVTVEVPVFVEREVVIEIPVEVLQTVIVEIEVPVTNTPEPTASVQSTATANPTDVKLPPTSDYITGQGVSIGLRRVGAVIGLPTVSPYRSTPTIAGGVEEYFFHYENDDPMTPELVESWDIDPAGTRVRMTMRKGLGGAGIPFNSPVAYEDIDFGVVDADNVVRYFNESNITTNPHTTYGNSGDLADIFLEARKIDDWTVEIGLVMPVYFCLPISQFGCLNADRGLYYLAHADTMGVEWANNHHIGTGPFVQEECIPGHICVTRSLYPHWRVFPEISSFTQLQVGDPAARVAMLRNDELDMAAVDFTEVAPLVDEGFRFLETMPGGYIGQSILFPGNLWEHSHARTGEPLEPWNCDENRSAEAIENACGSGQHEGPYKQDYPWIGNPWGTKDAPCSYGDALGRERCGDAPYSDTDNRTGLHDMDQARLVRVALSIAIDRNKINERFLDGRGTPIYSEYMGPEYPGWDPARHTGCWDWLGNREDCGDEVRHAPFRNGIPWELVDGELVLAGGILNLAGYRLVDGKRQGFEKITLQSYVAEAGEVSLDVAKYITAQWEQLGIEIEEVVEDYGGMISQRMRRRVQYFPVLKNGFVYSNAFPLDWPMPNTDSSFTRPGWGVGFESQPGARWFLEILSEPDKAAREKLHLDWVDYSMFWVQYAGVFQIPKGVIAGPRIAAWNGRQEHNHNVSNNPEFIILR